MTGHFHLTAGCRHKLMLQGSDGLTENIGGRGLSLGHSELPLLSLSDGEKDVALVIESKNHKLRTDG